MILLFWFDLLIMAFTTVTGETSWINMIVLFLHAIFWSLVILC